MSNEEVLEGQIERLTFFNEENGFTVAKINVSGQEDLVTAVGKFINPTPGEHVKMWGSWAQHPKYDKQFKISSYETQVPSTVEGIEKYLASGVIRGMGPVMAQRVVDRFKEKTLEVMNNNIDRLLEVEGIGKKRLKMVKGSWDEHAEIRSLMLFLQSHDVSAGYAPKIYKQYGRQAVDVLKENPYVLATNIKGIGFITADKIASKLGVSKDSILRVQAGILFALNSCTEEGHVCYPLRDLLQRCGKMLEVEEGIIVEALEKLVKENKVVREEAGNEDPLIYLKTHYIAETKIAQKIKELLNYPPLTHSVDVDKALSWVQQVLTFSLARKQIEAIKCALASKAMVLTGGPGTGKTTIIEALLKVYSSLKIKTLLAAPTGRAAKRITEATGHEAKTVHRLLEYSVNSVGFQRDETNPLSCQVLIIDEASMVDIFLMHNILKALPPDATLILVGDVNQLPPVGPGNVLKDIINSGKLPVVELKEIFRQAQESLIILNSHRINEGLFPILKSGKKGLQDFYFIEQTESEVVLDIVIKLVKNRIPERFGFDPFTGTQVLTPMNRGIVGTGNLNIEMQQALNPGDEQMVAQGKNFRVADKVMQIRNNYDKEVYNGDIGRVLWVNREEQELSVSFNNKEIKYSFTELDELVLAYAISVHKSQGSEFPAVVLPLLTQHYVLLQRNLLYTAVTRGKKLVVIVGDRKALGIAIRNNKPDERHTLLERRITRIKW